MTLLLLLILLHPLPLSLQPPLLLRLRLPLPLRLLSLFLSLFLLLPAAVVNLQLRPLAAAAAVVVGRILLGLRAEVGAALLPLLLLPPNLCALQPEGQDGGLTGSCRWSITTKKMSGTATSSTATLKMTLTAGPFRTAAGARARPLTCAFSNISALI
jgi:hypothetical protein